eukprot:scaffold12269_cov93-Skeletonema_dohrnii-CCMP3373.AAC.1
MVTVEDVPYLSQSGKQDVSRGLRQTKCDAADIKHRVRVDVLDYETVYGAFVRGDKFGSTSHDPS